MRGIVVMMRITPFVLVLAAVLSLPSCGSDEPQAPTVATGQASDSLAKNPVIARNYLLEAGVVYELREGESAKGKLNGYAYAVDSENGATRDEYLLIIRPNPKSKYFGRTEVPFTLVKSSEKVAALSEFVKLVRGKWSKNKSSYVHVKAEPLPWQDGMKAYAAHPPKMTQEADPGTVGIYLPENRFVGVLIIGEGDDDVEELSLLSTEVLKASATTFTFKWLAKAEMAATLPSDSLPTGWFAAKGVANFEKDMP